MANALWVERRHPFEAAYLERVQRHFRARLDMMDFTSRPEAARDVINRWVEGETGNRIKDLLPPGLIDDWSRLILTNAIYFKGNWADVFPESATKDGPFYLPGGGTVQAPQMHQTGGFDYAEAGGRQLLSLPYTMPGVDMVLLLPAASNGLSDLEKRFTRRTPRQVARFCSWGGWPTRRCTPCNDAGDVSAAIAATTAGVRRPAAATLHTFNAGTYRPQRPPLSWNGCSPHPTGNRPPPP